ncbi:MAG: hypothetical protein GF309_06735 [Candidatus Lokiarchaeota archaeon]|nr:hypothetical protein [Candidatus Lokiarchaeota archaeon]
MSQTDTYFYLFLRFVHEGGHDSTTIYETNLTDDFNGFLEKQSASVQPVDDERMAFIILVVSLGS